MSSAAEIAALLAKYEPPLDSLQRSGLKPEWVRKATARYRPVEMPTPAEARLAMAKHVRASRRGRWGCKGMPEHVVKAMYAEYQAGKSCSDLAEIFGGTRQSVYEVFKVRRLKLRSRGENLQTKIAKYGGRSWTMHKGYFRATTGDRRPLHQQMWEDANGPIPPGWSVSFRDANPHSLFLENFFCAPKAEVTRFHHLRLLAARAQTQ